MTVDDATILIRGAAMDVKPGEPIAERISAAGGTDDGRPLAIHHTVVDIHVSFPHMLIEVANVVFEVHSQPACQSIAMSYHGLVGLSISRGFTHKVRELFGGPRGGSHTTPLLQAMPPVALRCVFSIRSPAAKRDEPTSPLESGFMRVICHAWSGRGRRSRSSPSTSRSPRRRPLPWRSAAARR